MNEKLTMVGLNILLKFLRFISFHANINKNDNILIDGNFIESTRKLHISYGSN